MQLIFDTIKNPILESGYEISIHKDHQDNSVNIYLKKGQLRGKVNIPRKDLHEGNIHMAVTNLLAEMENKNR